MKALQRMNEWIEYLIQIIEQERRREREYEHKEMAQQLADVLDVCGTARKQTKVSVHSANLVQNHNIPS